MKRSLALSLIGALVLLGSVVGAYYVSWLIVNPPPMLSVGLQGTVSISVNGREVIRQTDLPTNAFYQVLQNILNGISTSTTNGWNTQCLVFSTSQGTSDLGTITVGSTNFSPLTSGGTTSCLFTGYIGPSNNYYNWSSSVPQPLWVGIGVGTGTVGRNDKALFTKLAVAPATFTLNTQNPIGFTIAGSITISGTASITESALYYINCAMSGAPASGCFGVTTANTYWALMLQHDTFNAVSVNPGDVVTVAYTINMPTSCTQSITTNCSNLGLAYLLGNCLTHSDVSGGLYTPFCLTHPGVTFTGSYYYVTAGQAGFNPVVALFDNSVSPARTASATTMSVVWLQNNNYINIYGVAQAPLGLYDTVIYSFTIAGSGGLSAQVLQYKTTSSPINLVAGQAVGFQLQGP